MTDPQSMSDAELMAALGMQSGTQRVQRPAATAPRGIRNNNPGNIEDGPFARSLPGYAGSDGRFARFDTPDAGGQAKARLIGSYIQRGFDTPMEIINRWAPPTDNNPTQQYAAFVAQRVGIGPNDRVTEADIPAIAQAIAEFENGQTQQYQEPGAVADDLSQFSDEDLLAALTIAEEATDAPEMTVRGRQGGRGLQIWADMTPEEQMAIQPGDEVLLPDGRSVTAAGSPYSNPEAAKRGQHAGGNLYTQVPGIGDAIGAFATAANEQLPFGDELSAATVGALSGMGYDRAREAQMFHRDRLNQTNRDERIAGGLTGFGVGLALPGSTYVSRGATGIERAGRAAQVGAGYGGLYGAGAREGGIGERTEGAVQGAALGAAGGGLAQVGLDRFARAAQNPSAARQLSREGVSLTPGQMLEGTPVVGEAIRKLEDSVTGVLPFVQSARNRGVDSLNVAAYNRALAPIGEQMPRGAKVGHEGIDHVQRRLGQAYDEILPSVSAQLDQPLYDQLAGILDKAAGEMEPERVRQLAQVFQNRVFRNVDQSDATLTGQQFKQIESELGALARQRLNAQDPSVAAFGEAVSDIQGALRDMVARQNPAQAQRIQSINEGYANLVRLERAAGSSAADGRGGVFLPGELSTAVRQGASRAQLGRGDALMQDLATNARQVLPNTIGDSGTVSRGVGAALVAGTAIAPKIALPAAVASLSYSRPAQAMMNLIYRSTDRFGGASGALETLARLARDNPALVPVYERALLQAQLAFPHPGQERTRASRGLFGAKRPQTASQ